MKLNYIVIDDFFKDPDQMRALAISKKYTNPPNLPYRRSEKIKAPPETTDYIKRMGLKGKQAHYYQVMTKRKTFVHIDVDPCYAGIVFLNHEVCPGTTLLKHKKLKLDGIFHQDPEWLFRNNMIEASQREKVAQQVDKDKYNLSKWDETITFEAKYNRFVMFNTHYFHINASGWGTNANNGRLTYIFFHYDQNYIRSMSQKFSFSK